jgi:hypothetical protein
VNCTPLLERVSCQEVIIDVGKCSLPYDIETPTLHHEFSHSPSLPLIEDDMESQQYSCRSQLEPPSNPFDLNNSKSETNGLIHYNIKNNDYIILIDIWIDEVC